MRWVRQRQAGQAMVLFALGMVGIVALVALVLDGSYIYVQRRTAQTAADAGALAGARALREASTVGTISSEVTAATARNTFGGTQSVQCIYLVNASGAPFGTILAPDPAACPSGAATTINGASGVHVDVRVDFHTFLAGMLNVSQLNAVGRAAAQLGTPAGVYTRDAPLIVCGGGTKGAAARLSSNPAVRITNGQPDLDPSTTSLPTYTVANNSGYTMERFLLDDGTIDAGKAGHVYYLKGSVVGQATATMDGHTVTNDCGAASNKFDGGAAPDQILTSLPGQLDATSGNSVANIGAQVEAPGGCAAGTTIDTWTAGSLGCVMILPVSDGTAPGSSSSDPSLHIQTTAAFYVWCNKSSSTGTNCQEWLGQLISGDDVVGNLLTTIVITNNSAPSAPVAVHLTE
jgi:Putative Flp pilus-assembly TadE/G-like